MNEARSSVSARQRLRLLLAAGVTRLACEDLFPLGVELHQAGDLEAALAAFESAASVMPEQVGLWHALATLRFALGRPAAALAACNEALRLDSECADTLFNTAVVLEALGDPPAAAHCYQRVLGIDGNYRGALLNQVALLLSEKRLPDARVLSQVAIGSHPDDADCWFNHGEVMTTAGRHAEACAAYERALALRPAWSKADIAAAVSTAALGQLAVAGERLKQVALRDPQAYTAFRSPLETDRVSAYPELEPGRIALVAAYQKHRACDWSAREDFLRLFRQVIDGNGCKPMDNPDLPFLGLGLPLGGEYCLRAARQVAHRLAAETKGVQLARPARRTGGRLRIGYLSGDFRAHATAYLMSRLPGLHDRERFEVFVYSSGPDDGSEVRQEIAAGADAFCDVARFDAAATAQRIAMDAIDILVDLSGYTLHARTAALALRPAPLQLSYLAYLQTSGAPWIDYAVLDHNVLTADERPFWQEQIVYLPHTLYLCDDRQAPDAVSAGSRVDAGLPENAFVFCCLNAAWKIDPETFACWMSILHRTPRSVLWLHDDTGEAAAHLRNAASKAGVDAARLIFAPRVAHAVHLARFRLADVFLDTFACNAHTTCIEALAAGVPVLTLPGETVVARVAAGLLRAHGLPELVAGSCTEYVESACRLADDPGCLADVQKRIENRAGSMLFSTGRRVRELERAYELMWARHTAGLLLADFDVPHEAGEVSPRR